jgi:hypothetical protein
MTVEICTHYYGFKLRVHESHNSLRSLFLAYAKTRCRRREFSTVKTNAQTMMRRPASKRDGFGNVIRARPASRAEH